ncbi:MAG TPA: FtsX-like permease family protein [Candidatus Binatia bacterium]|nr:FtsX-like permease family protein [Candidatus Binatia bacterium]
MLIAFAVAIGVTLLLAVFADFHAFEKTSDRPSWESTSGTSLTSVPASTPKAELWDYSENIYKGQFIEQLDVAALGTNAPVLPGISKLPGPGQFYASPALAKLLKTVPKDELGDRFSGTQIGIIGERALSFPTELVIYDGLSPNQFADLQDTIEVSHIATTPQLQGTTNIYKDAFGIGALAILFPLLILINTATRLSASRREERYAAMRLVGATPHQINVIASVDAIASSLLGVVVGSLIFLAVRPAVADISFSGVKFFSDYVTPTIWAYLGLIIGAPILAAIASLISLRRVNISPLGVSRKTRQPKPRAWRIIPLIAGIIMFPYAADHINNGGNGGGNPGLLFGSFLLIMVGIVLSGSWLTMQVTRLLARFARSPASLLAARRLSDNPKGAYRAISGLVLAVFIGSFVSVLVPALNQAQNPSGQTSLSNVLRIPYSAGSGTGLSPSASAALVSKMESYPGTLVVPFYANPAFIAFQQQQIASLPTMFKGRNIQVAANPNINPPGDSITACASLTKLSTLGSCPPGAKAVAVNAGSILDDDNPLYIYKDLPIVSGSSSIAAANLGGLSLDGMLIKTNNAGTLEQIRTYLTVYNATSQNAYSGDKGDNLSGWQMGALEPETVGEVATIRDNDDSNVGRAVLAIIALTLITAGCSLAVTVGGSLVERKRPFTLLRVSGVSLGTLYKVILYEAALPLIFVSILAAGIGLGVGIPVVKALLKNLEPKGTTVPPVYPSIGYYIALGGGLIVALGLVVITLPLLKRMTKPEDARFE